MPSFHKIRKNNAILKEENRLFKGILQGLINEKDDKKLIDKIRKLSEKDVIKQKLNI